MRTVLALTGKDLRLLVADRAGFFFAFVFPILYATLFGAIMSSFSRGGGDAGLKIVVVDEDRTDGSRAFADRLSRSREFRVTTLGEAEPAVGPTGAPAGAAARSTADAAARGAVRDRAADMVRRGQQLAYVVLPEGFGAARRRMFYGEPPTIEVGIDPGRQAEAAMLEGLLTAMLYEGMQEILTDPTAMNALVDDALAALNDSKDVDPVARAALGAFLPALRGFMRQMPAGEGAARAFQPARIEKAAVARRRSGPTNAYSISFPQGVVWGIMSCAAGFGISIVTERQRGTLMRLRMAPIGRGQILAGKALACMATTLGVAGLLLGLARIGFGVQPDSYVKLGLGVICVAVAFVGIMMLLSVLGRTEQSAGGIGWSILTVMAMIGGGMIPLAFLPGWLQQVASVSPVKWSILAMEGATWRSFSYGEMLTPCAVLIGVGATCFALGTRAFRWSA